MSSSDGGIVYGLVQELNCGAFSFDAATSQTYDVEKSLFLRRRTPAYKKGIMIVLTSSG